MRALCISEGRIRSRAAHTRIRHPNEACRVGGAQFPDCACTLVLRPESVVSHRAFDWRSRQDLSLGKRTLRQVGSSFSSLVHFGRMSQPLTADDLLPLIAKLSSAERRKLFRLIQKVGSDVEAYRAVPPAQDEFSSDEETLAWDGDGWEDVR